MESLVHQPKFVSPQYQATTFSESALPYYDSSGNLVYDANMIYASSSLIMTNVKAKFVDSSLGTSGDPASNIVLQAQQNGYSDYSIYLKSFNSLATDAGMWWNFYTTKSGATNLALTIHKDGFVGINGVPAPAYALEVKGSARADTKMIAAQFQAETFSAGAMPYFDVIGESCLRREHGLHGGDHEPANRFPNSSR